MINGKRRHRAALIAEFTPGAGKGAHGPNIGMIPSIAIKNVEILRDGAAAQYGADAIAGVINFQMKDAAEGGALRVQYGEFYQDEQSYKVEGNIGLPLGKNGFINASMEYSDNDALSRGHQRPNAQTLIDNGVPVGQDTPFDDAPFAQTWGRPAIREYPAVHQFRDRYQRQCRTLHARELRGDRRALPFLFPQPRVPAGLQSQRQ